MANGQEPVFRYVGMGTITIYHVSEDELRILELGEPSSMYLNFAVGFLSVAASFGASLALAEVKSDRIFTVLVIVAIGSAIAGGTLLGLWRRASQSSRTIVQGIRRRSTMPEGTMAEPPALVGGGGDA